MAQDLEENIIHEYDYVTVVIDGDPWKLQVCYNYMSMQDHGMHSSDTVIKFFKALGIDDENAWASKVYGYPAEKGHWPSWQNEDKQAPLKIINALKEEKKVSCIKINDIVWYKDTIGDLEELKKLKAKLDKDKYHVTRYDNIIFKVHGKTFNYSIAHSHLHNNGGRNDEIFTELGLNPEKFCKEAYGYKAGQGCCPICDNYDYDALSRLVSMLATYCDSITIERHDEGCIDKSSIKGGCASDKTAAEYIKTTLGDVTFDMQTDDYWEASIRKKFQELGKAAIEELQLTIRESPVNPDPTVGLTIKKFNVKF